MVSDVILYIYIYTYTHITHIDIYIHTHRNCVSLVAPEIIFNWIN